MYLPVVMTSPKRGEERKDRLIQTRVCEEMEQTLKREAARRRLSVSQLIRHLLEDSFSLVDNVVEHVDTLVQDSLGLAGQVRRDAGRIAESVRRIKEVATAMPGTTPRMDREGDTDGPARNAVPEPSAAAGARGTEASTPSAPRTRLEQVLAWNPVTVNRPALCAECGASLARGDRAHLGVCAEPGAAPLWLCDTCLGSLAQEPSSRPTDEM